jgi:hypothetical protein
LVVCADEAECTLKVARIQDGLTEETPEPLRPAIRAAKRMVRHDPWPCDHPSKQNRVGQASTTAADLGTAMSDGAVLRKRMNEWLVLA